MRVPLRGYLGLLGRYLRPWRGRVAALGLVLAAMIGLQLLGPQILRLFIDGAVQGAGHAGLVSSAVLFMLVALAQQLTAATGRYLGEDIGLRATNELRGDLVAWCLHLDMALWRATRPGELIERTDGDVELLANFFSQFVVGLLANLVLLVAILVVLFGESAVAGLAMTAFSAAALWALFAARNYAVPYWEAVRGYSGRFYGFLGEHLSGTEDIQGLGAGRHVFRRLQELLRSWYPVARRADIAGISMWMLSTAVFAVGTAISFAVGAHLYARGALSIGTVYLMFHYTQLLRRPIDQVRTQMQNLQRASAGIVRIQRLLETKPAIADGPGGATVAAAAPDAEAEAGAGHADGGALSVAFRRVSFSYAAGSEAVLRDVHFELAPGKALGLLGRTGSGKTTVARLLLRLYDPSSGAVLVGGIPTATYRLADLRSVVGMVSQDVEILSGTVRDNLTFFADGEGRPEDDDALWAVLEELGLAGWCRGLDRGLDTVVGGGGQGLSAGEAQLLGLARVFPRSPRVIVLDEASSRLDPATGHLLEKALDRLLAGRTVSLFILIRINSRVALLTFGPMISVVLLSRAVRGRLQEYRRASRQAAAAAVGAMGEVFGAVQAVKLAVAEERATAHIRRLGERRRRLQLMDRLATEVLGAVYFNTVSVGTGLVLLLAAGSMADGTFSVGDFSLFAYYIGYVSDFTHFLGQMTIILRHSRVSMQRLTELMPGAGPDALVRHSPVYLDSPPPGRPA